MNKAALGLGLVTLAGATLATAGRARAATGSRSPSQRWLTLSQRAGLSPAVLEAIAHVESRGRPSAIRFEPHVFARARMGGNSRTPVAQLKEQAARDGIPYTPKDEVNNKLWSVVSSETNKAAFDKAYAIDPRAAIRATSWGNFQVMGWALLAEYGSPSQAKAAFYADPTGVSDVLLVRWIGANPRAKAAAEARDWHTFASIYNGPSNVDRYAPKLSAAYASSVSELGEMYAGVAWGAAVNDTPDPALDGWMRGPEAAVEPAIYPMSGYAMGMRPRA